MTVKDYVSDILSVPVTRIGNTYIVEAIELTLDTREHKFYPQLSEIHHTSTRYLEKAMRDSKDLGLRYMDQDLRLEIFKNPVVPVTEYIIRAAEYYRRNYEEKES